jgi:hypothetical protein
MRRFSNCFLGSEAVDFLSEDQYLERNEVKYLCCLLQLPVLNMLYPAAW